MKKVVDKNLSLFCFCSPLLLWAIAFHNLGVEFLCTEVTLIKHFPTLLFPLYFHKLCWSGSLEGSSTSGNLLRYSLLSSSFYSSPLNEANRYRNRLVAHIIVAFL